MDSSNHEEGAVPQEPLQKTHVVDARPMATMHCRALWLLFVVLLPPVLWSQNQEPTRLIGVGSTLPMQVYGRLLRSFEESHSDIRTSYMPFGSSRGLEMVAAGTADFGVSDAPVSERHLARKILFFPMFVAAVVPVYNLPGVTGPLKFTPKALAGIYLGKITKWDDPELTGPNPKANLPSSEIVVIHTADGRGTTYIWTDYLSKVSSEWKTRVGKGIAVQWPVGTVAEGTGNVAKAVKDTPNAIGYVGIEQAVQAGVPYGIVQNSAGKFVSADSVSMDAAADRARKFMPRDFRYSITNSPGDASYPIASFTWFVIAGDSSSAPKQEAIRTLLRWLLDEGQKRQMTAGFVRLPKEIVEKELAEIVQIP